MKSPIKIENYIGGPISTRVQGTAITDFYTRQDKRYRFCRLVLTNHHKFAESLLNIEDVFSKFHRSLRSLAEGLTLNLVRESYSLDCLGKQIFTDVISPLSIIVRTHIL